ncbi:hypothetical protein PoB_006616600 [Plakobranchus ocellatus]|uniref:Uncharacterized protein n=1 Tax=Plakobranchus ocellatus TaxID=259542 RepID=A0AAV4D6T5_9GAST|nr:hypothetical protein PoB_006616600 [Plakobranchus ocellatus]
MREALDKGNKIERKIAKGIVRLIAFGRNKSRGIARFNRRDDVYAATADHNDHYQEEEEEEEEEEEGEKEEEDEEE